ncbi:hypothetical protein KDJ56_18545 [Brevibacillus composti]|uniref:Uncharacterized protein n=1 Tax=Brevibacillus composti TaxID=2796470 RepID=A0A7T5EJU1_9BACL|nr:hypothetical protein [Brevibacillus composti]QQE73848.1 hypothetical protein JD108_18605 [Brevibacillus composti]QUO40933.1 hypothetical protein KDJ56_18545 [Brevibacillus composti]
MESHIPGDFERIGFFFYPDRFQPSRVEAKLREGSEQVMVRGNLTFDRTFFSIPITAAF